jgi:hypothetical protein
MDSHLILDSVVHMMLNSLTHLAYIFNDYYLLFNCFLEY